MRCAGRAFFVGTMFLPLLGLPAGSQPATEKTAGTIALTSMTGKSATLSEFTNQKALVIVFVGTECPINNLYTTRLIELHKEFGPKGVQFLAINANVQDDLPRIKQHAQKHGLTFPVLRDEGNKLADLLGARRTPEAILLDTHLEIRYQGRIDDQFGIDYQRPAPTRRDLALALEQFLAGKQVRVPTTPVAGCMIGRVAPLRTDGQITFARQVSRILQKHCQECHRPGQAAPMGLLTFDDAVAWAPTIKDVISDRRMPPWYADPKHGKFSNDRSLPEKDRELLLSWIDQGMPRGSDKDLPPPLIFPKDWTIGTPDAVLHMPEEFEVPAHAPKGGVPYKFFTVETNFGEDKWIERAEARAGAPEVVHHILTFIVPPERTFSPATPNAPVLCGTAPGEMPLKLPPGTAKFLPKGAKIVFQMHYTPNGKPHKDRSSIAMVFAKKLHDKVVLTRPIGNP